MVIAMPSVMQLKVCAFIWVFTDQFSVLPARAVLDSMLRR
jgi:hypothetical protein